MPERRRRFLDEPYLSQRLLIRSMQDSLRALAQDTTLPGRLPLDLACAFLLEHDLLDLHPYSTCVIPSLPLPRTLYFHRSGSG